MPIKSMSIRTDDQLLHKLPVVADFEGRAACAQILYLIRKSVEKFEKEHGEIER